MAEDQKMEISGKVGGEDAEVGHSCIFFAQVLFFKIFTFMDMRYLPFAVKLMEP